MSAGRMRRAVALAAGLAAAAAPAASAEAFRIGVRPDARPFVFQRADGSYAGFLYDLCRAAVAGAGIADAAVELVPVLAGDRFERLDDPAAPLDLLCDPTTITKERAERRAFTPIVFIASSVSLVRDRAVLLPAAEAPPGCAVGDARQVALVGWVDKTTSDATVRAMTAPAPATPGEVALCPVPFARHDEGVRAICAADARLSFYVGDADILSAQLDEMRREGLPCRVSFSTRAARPEPYALVVRDRDGLPQRIAAGVYAFFRDGGAERSFAANFGARNKSVALAALFALYRLP